MKHFYGLGLAGLFMSVGLHGELNKSALANSNFTERRIQSQPEFLLAQENSSRKIKQLKKKVNELIREGKDQEATIVLEEIVAIHNLEPDDPKMVAALNDLAALYLAQERYKDAESLYKKIIEIDKNIILKSNIKKPKKSNKKSLKKEELKLIEHQVNLANFWQTQSRYADAEPLLIEAVEMARNGLPEVHINLVKPLQSLANLYEAMGRYSEAELLLKEIVTIAKKYDHVFRPSALNNLAEFYHSQGYFSAAEPLYKEAIKAQSRSDAEKDLRTLLYPSLHTEILNNLSSVYQSQGRFLKSEELLKKAIKIAKRTEQPILAVSQSELASLYQIRGLQTEAEKLFQQSLKITKVEKKRLPNERDVKQVLKQRIDDLPDNNPIDSIFKSIHSILGVFSIPKMSQYTIRMFHSFDRKGLPKKDPDLITILNNLAKFYQDQGQYSKAESLYLDSLSLTNKDLKNKQLIRAYTLNDLANLYLEQGQYLKAEPFLTESLKIARQTLPNKHPLLARILGNQAMLYRVKKDLPQTLQFLEEGLDIEEENLGRNLAVGDESQKRTFISLFEDSTNAAISIHQKFAPNDIQAARLAFTTILRRKGRIQDVLGDGFQRLRNIKDPKVKEQLTKLSEIRAQIAQLAAQSSGQYSSIFQEKLNRLSLKEQELVKSLIDTNTELTRHLNPVNIDEIQKKLPSDTALIEFFEYKPLNITATSKGRWGKPHYAVYILPHQGDISWVDLGPVDNFKHLVSAFILLLDKPDSSISEIRSVGRGLGNKILQPLLKHIGSAKHLLIVPDGQLNLIPFEALIEDNDVGVINQGKKNNNLAFENVNYFIKKFQFTYLTSGKDLLRLQDPLQSSKAPLLLVNPDYDQQGIQLEKTKIKTSKDRGTLNHRSGDLAKLNNFSSLDFTQEEGEEILAIFPQFKLFSGQKATESLIKQYADPSILHIATHGFFLKDPISTQQNNQHQGQYNIQLSDYENPMLRSGLALAGFNRRDGGSDNDDGVLTALEVSGLDLSDTQLVVMSACETGVGDWNSGEGVYGLRRAFTLSGARSQLMSLWNVSDESTKDLMVEYYRRLKQNQGRGEALREAQLAMIESKLTSNSGESYSHPNFWASFVKVGDWRPLQGSLITESDQNPGENRHSGQLMK